jgi:putative FmdB family regulatory protein
MPLYEYECGACGGRFEVIQKFSEMTEACRRCGKGPVRRLASSPAIQFKGSGWYITDYAQKGKTGSEGSEGQRDGGDQAAKTDKADTGDAKRSDSTPAAATPKSDTPSSSTTPAATTTPATKD